MFFRSHWVIIILLKSQFLTSAAITPLNRWLCERPTDRRDSGFFSVIFWPLLSIDTFVCFTITDHSIRSHISESCNNRPPALGNRHVACFSKANLWHGPMTFNTLPRYRIPYGYCATVAAGPQAPTDHACYWTGPLLFSSCGASFKAQPWTIF